MRYPDENNIVWQFTTRHFHVVCHIEESTIPPQDSMESFGNDDIDSIRTAIEEGHVLWFDAFVSVWYCESNNDDASDMLYVAHDSLSGCAYTSVDDFVASHRDSDAMNRNCSIMRAARGDNVSICHYFPSMVSEAIRMARTEAKRTARNLATTLRH